MRLRCLDFGAPGCLTWALAGASRCRPCAAKKKRVRNSATRHAADIVAEHRARHGDWCPGWGRPAHRASDLTADHVVPLAAGGSNAGEWSVLCRACNGRKGASMRDPLPRF